MEKIALGTPDEIGSSISIFTNKIKHTLQYSTTKNVGHRYTNDTSLFFLYRTNPVGKTESKKKLAATQVSPVKN